MAAIEVGNAHLKQVEARYVVMAQPNGKNEAVLDEVVAEQAHVHLEQMNDSEFCLIVETATERACFTIGAKRAPVCARELWRETKKRAAPKLRKR